MGNGCSTPPVPPEPSNRPWEMVISAEETSKSSKEMKFVRPNPAFALMPHYEDATKSVDLYLEHIEMGIVTSVLVGDLSPGLHNYLVAFKEFLKDFGLRFTEETMVEMTTLVVYIFTAEGQKDFILAECTEILRKMIKKPHIALRNFHCDWKAALRLYERVEGDKYFTSKWLIMETIKGLRQFFPESQTEEILEYLRSCGKEDMCRIFLPVNASTKEHQICDVDFQESSRTSVRADGLDGSQLTENLTEEKNKQGTQIGNELWDEVMDLIQNVNTKIWNVHRADRITDCLRETIIKTNIEEPIEKLLAILAKTDFESNVSTEVASILVKDIVRFHPETFSRLAAVLLPRLDQLLKTQEAAGEKKKKKKKGKSRISAMNCASVASMIAHTSAEVLVKHKEDVCKLISLLLDSDCEDIVKAGVQALQIVLFKLGRTYIHENTVKKSEKHGEIRDVYWHVADGSHQKEAVELLKKYVFPALEKMQDQNLIGFPLWKQLKIVTTWYSVCFFFPLPESKVNSESTSFSIIPPVEAVPFGISPFIELGEADFHRFRENTLEICEAVTARILAQEEKDRCLIEMNDLMCTLLDQTGDCWNENKEITNIGKQFKIFGADDQNQSVDSISSEYVEGIGFKKATVCHVYKNRIAKLVGKIYVEKNIGDVGIYFFLQLFRSQGDLFLSLESVLKELEDSEFLDEGLSHGSEYCEDFFLNWKKLNYIQAEVPGIKYAKERCLFDAKYTNYIPYCPGPLEEFCREIWRKAEKSGPWLNFSTEEQLQEAKEVTDTFGMRGEQEFYELAKRCDDSEASSSCHDLDDAGSTFDTERTSTASTVSLCDEHLGWN